MSRRSYMYTRRVASDRWESSRSASRAAWSTTVPERVSCNDGGVDMTLYLRLHGSTRRDYRHPIVGPLHARDVLRDRMSADDARLRETEGSERVEREGEED